MVLIVADKDRVVLPVLGQLRLTLGRQLGLIPEGQYNFLWITEFPFFEWDEESQSWLAMHHPFTMPLEECLPYIDSDPGSVRAQAYGWRSACPISTATRVRFVPRRTTWWSTASSC